MKNLIKYYYNSIRIIIYFFILSNFGIFWAPWRPVGSHLALFWFIWACLLAPLGLWSSLEIGTKCASHLTLWKPSELGTWQRAKRASHLVLWNSLESGTWQRAKRASHLVYIFIYKYKSLLQNLDPPPIILYYRLIFAVQGG